MADAPDDGRRPLPLTPDAPGSDAARISAELARLDGGTDPFAAAVRATPMPVVVTDPRRPDNPIVFANDAFCHLTGYAREEILGRNCRFLQGPETDPATVARVRAALARAEPIEVDLRNRRKGGEAFWNRLSISPVRDTTGAVAYFVASQVDVTAEREQAAGLEGRNAALAAERLSAQEHSEARLRLALEAGGLGDFEWDLHADVVRPSARARAIFGFGPGEGERSADYFARIVPEDRGRIQAGVEARLASGRVAYSYRIRLPDGAVRHVLSQGDVVRGADGAPARLVGVFADETERLAAEARLRASEERLRLVVEGATDYAILTIDRERRVTSWSAGAAAVFGYAADEILGWSADLLFTEEDRAAGVPECEAEQAWREGRAPDVRWHLRQDGARVFLNGAVRRLRDGEGRAVGLLKIARDETEARRAEERLQRSEARLRALVSASSEVLYSMNPDWTEMRQLSGGGFLADTGAPKRAWLEEYIHPDDQPRVVAAIREAMRTKDMFELEHRVRRADGSLGWTLSRAVPLLDAAGEVTEWFGVASDVTARKEAEAMLRELNATLEARVAERTAERDRVWVLVPDLIVVLGFDGRYRSVNPAWTEALGYAQDELVGRAYVDLVHPDDLAAVGAAFARVTAGEPIHDVDARLRHRDGSWRAYSWTCRPEGDFLCAIGRDVSGRRLLEEQMRQSQKMEAVGQLTGGIAHDFNNMLQGISGSLELMRRRMRQERLEEAEHHAEGARETVARAAALTQRLLAFARRQALDPRPVEPDALVEGMAELIRRTVGPGIAVELRLRDGIWGVLCDPNQIENVILNLAINARDAMADGGRITICTEDLRLVAADVAGQEGAGPGDYVEISVSDTGVGMDEATRERAFEPFFTTKPLGQGTGLGLSQVYGFVRQSGGFVRLDSAPDRGTTVRLYLPRHEAARGGVRTVQGAAEPEQAGMGGTVLLVEDEAGVRALAAEHLRELGYCVLEAADGAAALRLLHSEAGARADLLVTDVGLPGSMNGRQVADVARERTPELPVLFITGYAGGALQEQLAPGMAVIGKPFALDTLAARVRAMLETAPAK